MTQTSAKQRTAGLLCDSLMRDQNGAIIVKLALLLPLCLMLVGGAVDFGMNLRSKQLLQAAADSAAKAAALELTLIDYTKNDVTSLARSVVYASMSANSAGAGAAPVQVIATTKTDPLQVTVTATQRQAGYFGNFGIESDRIVVRSVAQVIGKPNICVLALDTSESGTLELWSKARMTAQNCAVYSNSTSTRGIVTKQTSSLSATMICSAGGTEGSKGSLSPEPITDCPHFADPLASRAAPAVGACKETGRVIVNATVTLQPGVYCGGLRIEGTAVVTFAPGEYVIKDGPLIVADQASISGEGTGFYLVGSGARFSFASGSTISLKAPISGTLGLLAELSGCCSGLSSGRMVA
jgi:Flp pilus assembly protein TadG